MTCIDGVIVGRGRGKRGDRGENKETRRNKKSNQVILRGIRGINQLLPFPDAATFHRPLVNKPLEPSKH
jgi:hypothetical protein